MISPTHTAVRCVLAAVAPWFLGAAALAQTDFYESAGPRLNGLDMDDDFVVGEPEDALVCDSEGGTVAATGFYVEDVDGDGVLEDQIFVDSESGDDSDICGAPTSPCASIDHAFNSRADGAASGGEDIVCARGTFTEEVRPNTSGAPTFKTKPVDTVATNEQRAFRYPDNPSMIIGWDADGDDEYPPLDRDDRFVFQNDVDGAPSFNFTVDTDGGADYVEIAHFRSFRPGARNPVSGGLITSTNRSTDDRAEYWYMHDFEAVEVNHRKCHSTANMFLNTFQFRPRWFAVEYADVPSMYGYVFRGGFNETDGSSCLDRGPMRFRGIDLTHRGLGVDRVDRDGTACSEISPGATGGGNIRRQWGCFSQWEDIDNRFVIEGYDSPVGPANDFIAGGVWLTCPRDIEFVGNYVEGYPSLPMLQTTNSVCKHRFAGNLKTSRNTFVDPIPVGSRFFFGVGTEGVAAGDPESNGFDGVYEIRENFFDFTSLSTSDSILGGTFLIESSSEADYSEMTLDVRDNLVIADIERANHGILEQHGPPIGTVIHEGNTYVNPTPDLGDVNDRMVDLEDETDYEGGDNSYYQCGSWRWNDGATTTDFEQWTEASGEESSSTCLPACLTDPNDLCLGGSRFHVQIDWRAANGDAGAGEATPLTTDSGFFWFFSPSNLEVVVKVLDGCDVNGHFWVFAGGLTDVEATVIVIDTLTGTEREYFNPLKTPFPAVRDITAFGGC
ncbi:MAG: hypothetical protein AAGK22_02735 [Acidobacteriota bacterium]